MSARVGIDAAALEPIDGAELVDLLEPLLSRVGVKPADFLAANITPKRVTLRLKMRHERGRTLPHSWAHIQVEVLEGVGDE